MANNTQTTTPKSQESKTDTASNRKPIHEIRIGRIKAAIWQNETDNGAQPSFGNAGQPVAFLRIADLGIRHGGAIRQPTLLGQIMPNILVSGNSKLAIDLQPIGECVNKLPGVVHRVSVISRFIGDQIVPSPQRLLVAAPIAAQCPSGQRQQGLPQCVRAFRRDDR